MHTRRAEFRVLALLVLVVSVSSCDVDLFGNDRRTIVGKYGLQVGAAGEWYLVKEYQGSGCGIVEGRIRQIGWNSQLILVEQESCSDDKTRSGWVVVDVQTGKIEGPIEPDKIKKDPRLTGIQVMTADASWKQLR